MKGPVKGRFIKLFLEISQPLFLFFSMLAPQRDALLSYSSNVYSSIFLQLQSIIQQIRSSNSTWSSFHVIFIFPDFHFPALLRLFPSRRLVAGPRKDRK